MLFESLHELGHVKNMEHCQIDHVKLLAASLGLSESLKESFKNKEERFNELTEQHTLAVLQQAAR